METLDNKAIETEGDLDRRDYRNFNLVSVGGFLGGVVAVYCGREMGLEGLEGFGYGVLGMDVVMNAVYRVSEYLRSE